MKLLIVMLCVTLFAACKESSDSDDPRMSVYRAGWRSSLSGTNTIDHQGSHFLRIERTSATLKIWHINDGKKMLKGELVFDPTIHEFAYVSPFVRGDKSYIDFAARRIERNNGDAWDDFVIEFPTPYRIGSFLVESTTTITQKEKILTMWIIESPDMNVMVAETESVESMLKASSEKPLSFVVIEAEPNK